jgi:hypothetical protein
MDLVSNFTVLVTHAVCDATREDIISSAGAYAGIHRSGPRGETMGVSPLQVRSSRPTGQPVALQEFDHETVEKPWLLNVTCVAGARKYL